MKDIFFFDNMVTPKIIVFVYWLLLLGAVVQGFNVIFSGYGGFSFSNFLLGILYAFLGAIAARIWCELMIVLFKINESLQAIREK